MKTHRRLVTAAIATAALATALSPVAAFADHVRTTFVPVTVAQGQAVRLVLTNLSDTTDSGLPPDPCHVLVRYFDGTGRALGRLAEFDIGSQKSMALNGPAVTADAKAPSRVRATVLLSGDSCKNTVQTNFEVYAAEGGSTLFLNPGVIRGFNPQPDPPGFQ